MKTSVLLAVVGLVAVVAVAGVALASGSVDRTYGTQASDPSGRGMMGGSGMMGNHMGGVDADYNGYQHMYQYQGNGSYGCPHDNDWNYSWDWDHDYGGCPCMD